MRGARVAAAGAAVGGAWWQVVHAKGRRGDFGKPLARKSLDVCVKTRRERVDTCISPRELEQHCAAICSGLGASSPYCAGHFIGKAHDDSHAKQT